MLGELRALGDASGPAIESIYANLEDGRAKLHVIWRLLALRRQNEQLFLKGGYTAVRVSGPRARHVVAFARQHAGETAITVVPRLVAGLGLVSGELPCGTSVWEETRVDLPFLDEGLRLREALTGRQHRVERGGLSLACLLERAPLAVLTST
jgi:(1->4)-alpha-D-glucan 1-alpha-D-glucosylmutase